MGHNNNYYFARKNSDLFINSQGSTKTISLLTMMGLLCMCISLLIIQGWMRQANLHPTRKNGLYIWLKCYTYLLKIGSHWCKGFIHVLCTPISCSKHMWYPSLSYFGYGLLWNISNFIWTKTHIHDVLLLVCCTFTQRTYVTIEDDIIRWKNTVSGWYYSLEK